MYYQGVIYWLKPKGLYINSNFQMVTKGNYSNIEKFKYGRGLLFGIYDMLND